MCDEVEQVIQAIIEDNPDQPIEVIDSGSYVRVQTPRFMRLTLASLQRQLGVSFNMRQLESMLSSFAGQIVSTTTEIDWQLTPPIRRALTTGVAE